MLLNSSVFVLLPLLFTITWGWFESCSPTQILLENQQVIVNSPNYPNSQYPQGSSCAYYFKAPSGYEIHMSCYISLYQINNVCSTEYFYISTDGNQQLAGSEFLCGNGNLLRTSIFNELTLGYTSTANDINQQTGYFSCIVKTQQQTCDCGWSVTSKIVSGTTTTVNEFVSMTGIVYLPAALVFCGGAIIHFRYILTAAHCFISYRDASQLGALVGDQDYSIGTDTPYSFLYYVQSIISHGSYSQETQKNDIALLQTVNDMIWKRGVGPVCLPFNYPDTFEGSTLDVAGWGSTSFGGPTSTTLKKVTLNIQSNNYCSPVYPTIDSTQMCSYTRNMDTCQYDSGSSLYYRPAGRLYTIAIVSFGGACGGSTPAINTKVFSYLTWIQQTTRVSFCNK